MKITGNATITQHSLSKAPKGEMKSKTKQRLHMKPLMHEQRRLEVLTTFNPSNQPDTFARSEMVHNEQSVQHLH